MKALLLWIWLKLSADRNEGDAAKLAAEMTGPNNEKRLWGYLLIHRARGFFSWGRSVGDRENHRPVFRFRQNRSNKPT